MLPFDFRDIHGSEEFRLREQELHNAHMKVLLEQNERAAIRALEARKMFTTSQAVSLRKDVYKLQEQVKELQGKLEEKTNAES